MFILAILKNADLNKTSSKNVRLTLENTFSRNFTDRKKEIDKMVMEYVNSIQNEEESEQSSSEEEEKKKSPPKNVAKKRKASDSDASSNNDSGDDYKPEKPARKAKKAKKADTGAKKKGTGRKGESNVKRQTLKHIVSRMHVTIDRAANSMNESAWIMWHQCDILYRLHLNYTGEH